MLPGRRAEGPGNRPSASRVDIVLNPKGRLEASGSFTGMRTHRVRGESLKEVDAALWAG